MWHLQPKVDALVRDPADTAQLDSIKIELKRLIELSETTRHKVCTLVYLNLSMDYSSVHFSLKWTWEWRVNAISYCLTAQADKAVREAEIVEHDADDLLVESRTLTTIIDIAINISQCKFYVV